MELQPPKTPRQIVALTLAMFLVFAGFVSLSEAQAMTSIACGVLALVVALLGRIP